MEARKVHNPMVVPVRTGADKKNQAGWFEKDLDPYIWRVYSG